MIQITLNKVCLAIICISSSFNYIFYRPYQMKIVWQICTELL